MVSDFRVVNSQIAVGHVFDLFKRFLASPDLKQIFPIHKEISLCGISNGVIDCQLTQKESLPYSPDVSPQLYHPKCLLGPMFGFIAYTYIKLELSGNRKSNAAEIWDEVSKKAGKPFDYIATSGQHER